MRKEYKEQTTTKKAGRPKSPDKRIQFYGTIRQSVITEHGGVENFRKAIQNQFEKL